MTLIDTRMDLDTPDEAQSAEVDLVSDQLNESTNASWLWAFLFGPIHFVVHGFWGRAAIVYVLDAAIIGFLVPPFIV